MTEKTVEEQTVEELQEKLNGAENLLSQMNQRTKQYQEEINRLRATILNLTVTIYGPKK